MRALAVALLLSVPLTAGDNPSLEKAVELFRSADAGKRAAGSQLAEHELRKLLAPLLKAMEDDDPEVRRRARRSIVSLVPEKEPQTLEDIRAALVELGAQQNQLLKALALTPQAKLAGRIQAELAQRTSRLLVAFGVSGTQWVPGKPGFYVFGVRKGGPAERLGLRRGDVILRVNGKDVTTSRDFPAALGDKPDWSSITVTRLRNLEFTRLPKE